MTHRLIDNRVINSHPMRQVVDYIRGKLDPDGLRFHYLKIGKAAPLLDELRAQNGEFQITWDQYEADDFTDYHFAPSYAEYDAAIINLGVTDENIADLRRDFWQEFIWKTKEMPLLLAIVYPDTTSFGSLSRSQLIESLSLVRLTDRPFEIFEHRPGVASKIFDWMTSLASVVHRIEREEEDQPETTQN